MKQVIILEKDESTPQVRFRFALWATVPVSRQSAYLNANATSQFTGASAQELQDIKDGKVRERVDTISFAAGTSLVTIETALQTLWTAYQAEITAANPWSRYGTFWDGTTWTGGGLA